MVVWFQAWANFRYRQSYLKNFCVKSGQRLQEHNHLAIFTEVQSKSPMHSVQTPQYVLKQMYTLRLMKWGRGGICRGSRHTHKCIHHVEEEVPHHPVVVRRRRDSLETNSKVGTQWVSFFSMAIFLARNANKVDHNGLISSILFFYLKHTLLIFSYFAHS